MIKWRIVFFGLFYLALSNVLFGQDVIFTEPKSDRPANYDIDVLLDAEEKTITAIEAIHWKNLSPDTVRFLQFHLYLNAFKNTQSVFMQDAGGFMRGTDAANLQDRDWSWVNVDKVQDSLGNDLTKYLEYIHAEDSNEHDQTVLQLNLPEPILPGASIRLNMGWSSKIPKVRVRTGFSKDYFLNVQWYPKLGIYEPKGMRGREESGWNCHPYHASAEYNGDFGNYNVNLTVPASYEVGATGVLYNEKENEDGTKTWSFHAEDVIDFAWVASPEFEVIEDQWKHVQIKLFIVPEYTCCTERYLSSAKYALEYLENNLAVYPFNTLTIVVPPFHGINSGAMEYPTFITALGTYAFPTNIRTPEYFVIHEFVHQYFMMMIATNEQEEAWLDEGFTSYYKSRILDHYYGEKNAVVDYDFFHLGAMELFRSRYLGMPNRKIAEITRPGWEYVHGGYRDLVYAKAAMVLRTLEGIVGLTTMDAILKAYFDKWSFKHPGGQDFIDVVNDVVRQRHGDEFGENMDWFFEQTLYGTDVCDYAVASISNTPVERNAYGIFATKGMKAESKPINQDVDYEYNAKVILHRLGELQFPVEVLVHFADGTEKLEKWDGKARAIDFQYPTNTPIEWVKIDPEQKLFMDINFLNNSLRKEVEKKTVWKYVTEFMVKVQNVLQGFSFLV
ncbi:MAG: M1 family metallopeptidase [Bacteroidota bacterium]